MFTTTAHQKSAGPKMRLTCCFKPIRKPVPRIKHRLSEWGSPDLEGRGGESTTRYRQLASGEVCRLLTTQPRLECFKEPKEWRRASVTLPNPPARDDDGRRPRLSLDLAFSVTAEHCHVAPIAALRNV